MDHETAGESHRGPLTDRCHPQPIGEPPARPHTHLVPASALCLPPPPWEGGLCRRAGPRDRYCHHRADQHPQAPNPRLSHQPAAGPKEESVLTLDQGSQAPPPAAPWCPPDPIPSQNLPALPPPIARLPAHPYLQAAGHPCFTLPQKETSLDTGTCPAPSGGHGREPQGLGRSLALPCDLPAAGRTEGGGHGPQLYGALCHHVSPPPPVSGALPKGQ